MSGKTGETVKRYTMMMAGNLFIGICVGAYRLSAFGVDAFTCMNLGLSQFVGMTFGTWQLLVNVVILGLVFWKARGRIGPGTVVNMVGVGYLETPSSKVIERQLEVLSNVYSGRR